MPSNYFYLTHGLGIKSQISFPELISGKNDINVVIRLESPDKFPKIHQEIKNKDGLSFTRYSKLDICFMWEGKNLFRVKNGEEIIINSEIYVNNVLFRSLILNQGLGILLHQRGILVLHCSAVSINGNAIAFCGWPQEGKSTIAAALNKKGYPLVADDVMAIRFDVNNKPFVFPSFPRIKLYDQVIERVAGKTAQFEKIHQNLKKFSYTPDNIFNVNQLPLKIVYHLEKSYRNRISAKKSQDALVDLIKQSYLINLFDKCERQQNLYMCSKLLKNMQIKRLERDQSLDKLQQLSQLIEKDFFNFHKK
ncbi:hypothetical protein [Methanobacterium formicicum]|uniref:HPr kinase n=1 Tax=Methanobacterium formicicum TaxID=2162 RepID=A0A843AXA1_METFO|nr:hypothetical protein [Methanobacterium formicicum]MBF4475774.1 hypothetical protein [Methanobacterium formicicum]